MHLYEKNDYINMSTEITENINDKLLYYFKKFGWVPKSGFGEIVIKLNDSKIVHVETKESHKIK